MGVGNHTFRYDSMRFDTIWFSSSSDAPRAWPAPRRRAHDARQLALSSASNGREIDHHSAHFLPREVGIRKLGSTYVRSKDREKHGNDGLVHVFRHLRGQKSHAFESATEVWHLRSDGFTDVVFHILLVF